MTTWRDRANLARKRGGITQEKLAESLDMTPGGVQKWLAGKTQPSLEDINRIAEILKVAPVWLTHGVTEDDVLDGLSEVAKATLRRFIRAERRHSSPSAVWDALNAVADLGNPTEVLTVSDESEHTRLTQLIDKRD